MRDFSGRKPTQYKINKEQIGIKDAHSEYINRIEAFNRNGTKLTKRSSIFRKSKSALLLNSHSLHPVSHCWLTPILLQLTNIIYCSFNVYSNISSFVDA